MLLPIIENSKWKISKDIVKDVDMLKAVKGVAQKPHTWLQGTYIVTHIVSIV